VSNYDGNEKVLEAVLEVIKRRGPILGTLIEYDLERDYGFVLFAQDIEAAVDTLRMQGHCIIENEDGLKISGSAQEFEKWRDECFLPRVEHMRDVLHVMTNAVMGHIHMKDIMIMDRGVAFKHRGGD